MYDSDSGSSGTFRESPPVMTNARRRPRLWRALFFVFVPLLFFLAGSFTTYLLIKSPFSPFASNPLPAHSPASTGTSSTSTAVTPTPSSLVFQHSLYAGNQTGIFQIDARNNQQRWHMGIAKNQSDLDPILPLAVQHNLLYLYNSDNDAPYLYALNTSDGSVRWKFALANDASLFDSGTIQFANGSVYIAQSSITQGFAQVIALDALSGRQQWMHHYDGTGVALGEKNSTDFTLGMELEAATANSLYAADIMSQSGVITTIFYILSTHDGSVLAQTTTHPQAIQLIRTSLLLNNTFYLATASNGQGFLYAYDATTGKVQWSHSYPSDPYSLVVQSNTLYMSAYDGSLYALSVQTGDRLWVHVSPGAISKAMIVNNTIYVTEGSFNYQTDDNLPENLVALDISSGQVLWTQNLTLHTDIRGSIAANPDRLYINLAANEVGIFSTTNGHLLSRFTIGAPPTLPPGMSIAGIAFMLAP